MCQKRHSYANDAPSPHEGFFWCTSSSCKTAHFHFGVCPHTVVPTVASYCAQWEAAWTPFSKFIVDCPIASDANSYSKSGLNWTHRAFRLPFSLSVLLWLVCACLAERHQIFGASHFQPWELFSSAWDIPLKLPELTFFLLLLSKLFSVISQQNTFCGMPTKRIVSQPLKDGINAYTVWQIK